MPSPPEFAAFGGLDGGVWGWGSPGEGEALWSSTGP